MPSAMRRKARDSPTLERLLGIIGDSELCLRLWTDTRFVMPARFFACHITAPMVLAVMGLPAIAPGKSHDTGRYVLR
jgi:hypothetical protein